MIAKKRFFAIYFAAILVLFVWQLISCGEVSFEQHTLGISADREYEILDKKVLETTFRISNTNPSGMIIHSFQTNGIEFIDEKIIVSLTNQETKELIQRTEINPSRELGNLYVPFEKEVPVGTRVQLRLWSEGFADKGPSVGLSKTSGYGSTLWEDGELVNEYLCASLCYEKKTYDFLKPILYFIAEIIIGGLLIFAAKILQLPLYITKEKRALEKRTVKKKKIIIGIGVIIIIVGVFLDYVYTYTVEPINDKRDYETLCDAGGEDARRVVLNDGDQISQVFSVTRENLSGLGVWIEEADSSVAILRSELYDMLTGEKILEKAYHISDLKNTAEYVDSSEVIERDEKIIEQYLNLDLQKILEDSKNQYYRVTLTVENAEEQGVTLLVTDGENAPLKINGQNASGNLCMLAFFSNNMFLRTLFIWMAAIATLSLVGIYIYISIYCAPARKTFVVTAIILGCLYCFLIPPYCVPDEGAHFGGIYRLSNEMLGISSIPGPERIYKRACDIESNNFETLDITTERYRELYEGLFKKAEDETLEVCYAYNTATNVTILNYLPGALGFTLARLLHLGHVPMLMLGRLFTLLASVGLLAIAINKAPFGKTVIAMVGLLPMTIQQMASGSYDGVILGVAYIFIAYCLYAIFEKRVSIVDVAVLTFSGCALAACKGGVYIPILGMLLLIPLKKRNINYKLLMGVGAALFSMALVFFAQFSTKIFSMLRKTAGTSFKGGGVELYTADYILEFPKETIRLMQNTIANLGDSYIQGILGGVLGKLNVFIPWFILIGFLALLAVGAMKRPEEKDDFAKTQKAYIFLLIAGSVVLILFSMLLAFTSVEATLIQGVQGRYFAPFIGLVFILCRNSKVIYRGDSNKSIFAAAILNVFTIGFALLSIL